MIPIRRQCRRLFVDYVACAWALLALAVPLALAMQPASAGGGRVERADDPYAVLARLDRDGDGRVSRLEAAALSGLILHVGAADVDGDGRLDREELARALALRAGR